MNIKYVQPDIKDIDTTNSRYQKLMDYLEAESQRLHTSKERRIGVIRVVPKHDASNDAKIKWWQNICRKTEAENSNPSHSKKSGWMKISHTAPLESNQSQSEISSQHNPCLDDTLYENLHT